MFTSFLLTLSMLLFVNVLTNRPYIFNIDNDDKLKPSDYIKDIEVWGSDVQLLKSPDGSININSIESIKVSFDGKNTAGMIPTPFYIPEISFQNEKKEELDISIKKPDNTNCLTFDYLKGLEKEADIKCSFTCPNLETAKPTVEGEIDIRKTIQFGEINIVLSIGGLMYKGETNGDKITYTKIEDGKNIVGVMDFYTSGTKFIFHDGFYIYFYDIVEVNSFAIANPMFITFESIGITYDWGINILEIIIRNEKMGVFVQASDQMAKFRGIVKVDNIKTKEKITYKLINTIKWYGEDIELNMLSSKTFKFLDKFYSYIAIKNRGFIIYDSDQQSVLTSLKHPSILKAD
jgi:hypothetical protein